MSDFQLNLVDCTGLDEITGPEDERVVEFDYEGNTRILWAYASRPDWYGITPSPEIPGVSNVMYAPRGFDVIPGEMGYRAPFNLPAGPWHIWYATYELES